MTALPSPILALFAGIVLTLSAGAAVAQAPAADLQAVLDAQARLGWKPVETLTVEEARRQPTLADAAAQVLKAQGRATSAEAAVKAKDLRYGADPAYQARLYKPANPPRGARPPLVIYYPDGGWVTGDLDEFDATPRLLAAQLNAVVIALEYRHAPENLAFSQHADAVFGYDWAVKVGGEAGANRGVILVVGEGAGGNLALYAAVRAFQASGKARPKVVLAIDPLVSVGRAPSSGTAFANARPLSAAGLAWYAKAIVRTPEELDNPKWDVTKAELRLLPHTVIVSAEIDPLREDGDVLERDLRAAGVKVDRRVFPGMTHGFFGLGALVLGAYDANLWALAQVRPDLDIHDADYHGGFGTLNFEKKPAAK